MTNSNFQITVGVLRLNVSDEVIEIPQATNSISIVSIHRYFDNLFTISRSGNTWKIHLNDPMTFWSVSRFLIVRGR